FNRRFCLQGMLSTLLLASIKAPPMPDRLLKLAESRW
ncbi:IS1595 family transposase, partial [Vibrio alfacsensis]